MRIIYYLNRWKNRRLNRKEFKERKTILRSFPYIAYIDPSNMCPLSCPLCPTGNRSSTQPKGLMSLETFKKIYDQIGHYLYELHLYNWGEPLLNRQVSEMIEYAKQRYNPNIIISSNLSGLPDKWAKRIVSSGVDLINISIDGVTQQTYEKYRVGGNLEQVLATLKYMVEIKRSMGLRKPEIRWQFIPMKHNESEIETARKFAKEIGVTFRIHRVRLNICDFDNKDTSKKSDDFVPQNTKHIRFAKQMGPDNPCKYLWDRAVFLWDGSLVPCCKIYSTSDVFALNLDMDFKHIWNDSTYRKARAIFSGKRTEDDFVCQKCVEHEGKS